MKQTLASLFVLLALLGCSKYEKENTNLREEIRMVREENNYLKAEIVGLKREMEEVTKKVKEEREQLKQKAQEEADSIVKKYQDENEGLKKKIGEIREAGKKKGPDTKNGTRKEVSPTPGKELPKKTPEKTGKTDTRPVKANQQ
jgi:predicted RNase H-like nuclease (RuvC/YqgF family)